MNAFFAEALNHRAHCAAYICDRMDSPSHAGSASVDSSHTDDIPLRSALHLFFALSASQEINVTAGAICKLRLSTGIFRAGNAGKYCLFRGFGAYLPLSNEGIIEG